MSFEILNYQDRYEEEVLNLLFSAFNRRYPADYLKSNISEKYILLFKERVVGFLEFEIALDVGEIFMIVVDSQLQGRGLGGLLMDFALGVMKERKVKEVYLDVSVKNQRAIDFYSRYGFETVSIRKEYYHSGDDAFLMKKDI